MNSYAVANFALHPSVRPSVRSSIHKKCLEYFFILPYKMQIYPVEFGHFLGFHFHGTKKTNRYPLAVVVAVVLVTPID